MSSQRCHRCQELQLLHRWGHDATIDRDDLTTRGPQVNSTGTRHPGATRMAFTTKIGYAQERLRCRIASTPTTVKVEVILPKWRPRRKAEPDVRLFWNTLFSDIKRHEEHHVDIAKAHGARA